MVTKSPVVARSIEPAARLAELDKLRLLLQVGTAWFDRACGWTFDAEMLRMWGLGPNAAQDPVAVRRLIVAEDRAAAVAHWEGIAQRGGQVSADFRIRHGDTGALRHLRGRWEAELDPAGLLRAIVTHVDVTDEMGALAMTADRSRRAAARADSERDSVVGRLARLAVEQRALLEQLDTTESRERTLLADAVHDDPIQLIALAILRIDNLKAGLSKTSGDALERIASLLEEAVERLRLLIVALSPPDLTAGLGIALLRLGEGVFVGTATSMRRRGPADVSLSPSAKGVAYRIMREAIVNARKHAGAAHVWVTLKNGASHTVLTLTDDGVGSDHLDAGAGHVGVATMRARADASGGALTIRSRPDHGTRVELRIPHRSGVRP